MNIVFKGRGNTTRFNILGAASKMEDSAKKIGVAARCLRQYMENHPGDELLTNIGTRNSEIGTHIEVIRIELNGLEPLFDLMAGERTTTT